MEQDYRVLRDVHTMVRAEVGKVSVKSVLEGEKKSHRLLSESNPGRASGRGPAEINPDPSATGERSIPHWGLTLRAPRTAAAPAPGIHHDPCDAGAMPTPCRHHYTEVFKSALLGVNSTTQRITNSALNLN